VCWLADRDGDGGGATQPVTRTPESLAVMCNQPPGLASS
jgi:hypothetical protein